LYYDQLCMSGFCNVCVCEGFVMCLCEGFVICVFVRVLYCVGVFGNMYTVLWLRFFLIWQVSLTLTEVFPCFFLSCKANARAKLAKARHSPHSSTLVCICVVRLLFVLFYVLFVCKCVLLPGNIPTAVNKYIISSYQVHKYIPGQHDSNINIQAVYTATTQTDFMRIVAKICF
jgi:hypothetical protein